MYFTNSVNVLKMREEVPSPIQLPITVCQRKVPPRAGANAMPIFMERFIWSRGLQFIQPWHVLNSEGQRFGSTMKQKSVCLRTFSIVWPTSAELCGEGDGMGANILGYIRGKNSSEFKRNSKAIC
jgi:hypothetical protein